MLFFKKILISKSLIYLGGAITALGGAGAFTVYQLDLFGKEPIDSSIFFASFSSWNNTAKNFDNYWNDIGNMPLNDLLRFLKAVSELETSKIDNDDLIKFDLIQKAKNILQNQNHIELLKKIYKNDTTEANQKNCIENATEEEAKKICLKTWNPASLHEFINSDIKDDIRELEKWRFSLGKIPPENS